MEILSILTDKRRLGNLGEDAAARMLRRKGYRILERNYVSEGHEIDIIAESRDTLAFIEVKTRTLGKEDPREPRPASSVTPEKQRAIISAARGYLSLRRVMKKKRFDIIEVYVQEGGQRKTVKEIKHLENSFNLNTAYKPNYR